MSPSAATFASASFAPATPRLSILIPFYRYDPRPLTQRLEELCAGDPGAVEIILADDGSGDEELLALCRSHVEHAGVPARLLALPKNRGRAGVRNLLARSARGRHVLLLDCDMRPLGPDFLTTYLALAQGDVDAAFGGFEVPPLREVARNHRLHQRLQARSEALDARTRARNPGKYVFTSNLLIRRELLLANPFDEQFAGWGWEDVEWGLRISAVAAVLQVDNAALHLGLDEPLALMGKYAQSAGNLKTLLASRPEAGAFPLVRAAAVLARAPFPRVLAGLFKAAALADPLPLELRALSAKLYRASLYGLALGAET